MRILIDRDVGARPSRTPAMSGEGWIESLRPWTPETAVLRVSEPVRVPTSIGGGEVPRRPGPVPKHSSERRRRNKDSKPTTVRRSRRAGEPAGGGFLELRAKDAIARAAGEPSAEVLTAARAVESRVTVVRAIDRRLEEIASPVPLLPDGTHPIARAWYESLQVSGQAPLYEPSDWAAAVFVAESMTRLLRGRKLSAVGFAAVWSAMGELLTTEGARRRVRIELEREEPEEEEGADELAAARERLRTSG